MRMWGFVPLPNLQAIALMPLLKHYFNQSLNIAVIGKVSSGKSSLINALLKLSRKQAQKIAKVGATSGITQNLTVLKLDEKVFLIDSPGLDDVRQENSRVTKQFLEHIDIGIFVITDSSDASQKKNLDDLRQYCDSVFVVLNKIDQWDDLKSDVLQDIIEQWKKDLNVNSIYPTCIKGYDPKSQSQKMDIRGVSSLRDDIENFLQKKGKELLLQRHIEDKQSSAIKIISTTLLLVATQVFIPGSAILITGTQASAIASLYYLYTGEIISSRSVLGLLPIFLSERISSSLFLFVQSFLPPTGIIDLAAVSVSVSTTLAILLTINQILASGARLKEEELLRSTFRYYEKKTKKAVNDLNLRDIKPSNLSEVIKKLISSK